MPFSAIVCGKGGAGKSALINSLIGHVVAIEGKVDHTTQQLGSFSDAERNIYYDTPGLFDPQLDEVKALEEIQKARAVDVVVLASPVDDPRAGQRTEDVRLWKLIFSAFGPSVWQRAVYALTFANEVSADDLQARIQGAQQNMRANGISVIPFVACGWHARTVELPGWQAQLKSQFSTIAVAHRSPVPLQVQWRSVDASAVGNRSALQAKIEAERVSLAAEVQRQQQEAERQRAIQQAAQQRADRAQADLEQQRSQAAAEAQRRIEQERAAAAERDRVRQAAEAAAAEAKAAADALAALRSKKCTFSYVNLRRQYVVATGTEDTWDSLKATSQERRTSGGLAHGARYFRTIGQGPELFAIYAGSVYYHDQDRWSQYRSAKILSIDP